MSNIEQALRHAQPISALKDLIEGNCKKIRLPDDLTNLSTPQPWKSLTAEALVGIVEDYFSEKPNLPLAIGYCAKMLTAGRQYAGTKLIDGFSMLTEKSDCNSHASVIVGRRSIYSEKLGRRVCEYLIQNSWGEACDSYSKDFECTSGRIWVDRETLLNNISSVTGLQ